MGIGHTEAIVFWVTQANNYIVPYAQMPNTQRPIPNAQRSLY